MERIIFYKSQKKAFIIMVSSLLVTFAGYLLVQYTAKEVIGWSLIVLSVLLLVLGIGTFFDRKPKIILTSKGITETSTIREEIEWDAIRQVDEFFYRGQYFICVLIDRNYKPGVLFPTWFYRFDRIYAHEGVKALFISVNLLDVNSNRLLQIIRKMKEADDREEVLKIVFQNK